MGILEKISEIEKEIARTQKNKATEYHLGLLKAKLAKYRAQLLEPSKSASSKGEGFDVMKSGDARVALIGFPSVGKSTFLSLMTSTASEAASYEFTTLTCIPGVIEYKGANIQLLDLPGIIEGAAQGQCWSKGQGTGCWAHWPRCENGWLWTADGMGSQPLLVPNALFRGPLASEPRGPGAPQAGSSSHAPSVVDLARDGCVLVAGSDGLYPRALSPALGGGTRAGLLVAGGCPQ
uniref:Developmentally regulated GTP binding protein 2 n=1 Tax=Sus scrofa TaxID=9823 RepID=A0A8D1EFA8_PIG